MARKFVAVLPSLAFVTLALHGCGIPVDWGNARDCFDPNDPGYGDPEVCGSRPDSGTDASTEDAGSSSSSSGSSARCSGTCVDNAPNDFAPPQIVYVGEPLAKYSYSCPSEAGAFGGREYLNLHVPDPGCPKCICGPIEGTCNPRPNNIFLRAGTCDVLQLPTTNFAAPEGWDGSCTSLNAMPANVECPPGSGVPCAQSVYASTLLDPEQACEPVPMPVPKATSDSPRWETMVLSCSTTPRSESCTEAAANTCLPPLPTTEAGWRYCVRHDDPGVHACPSSIDSPFSEQIIAYSDYIDTRKCTECGCKASGGSCHGILRVYKDNACSTNELVIAEGFSSEITLCSNFSMAGTEVGSKEMTDVVYVPGSCTPTGGVAVGTAYPDEATAATWCCMAESPKPGASAD
jgi:hypothetical protein